MQRARKSYGWTDQEDAFYSKSKIDLRCTMYDLKHRLILLVEDNTRRSVIRSAAKNPL